MVNIRLLYSMAAEATGADSMAGTAVVPMSTADADLPLVAGSLRALASAGWHVVLVAPGDVENAVKDVKDGPVVTQMLAAGWC